MDIYFTPEHLAKMMVDQFIAEPKVVADFTSGDGSLLRAARAKWPSCEVLATDIDETNLRRVRENCPGAKVGKCDFLSTASRRQCRILKQGLGRVSLILLNPPFSCRGGTKTPVSIAGAPTEVSIAMAFTVTAFNYLAAGGQLIAILPAGCMRSHRDQKAWELLRKVANVELISRNGNRVFPQCYPTTCVVKITKRPIEHSDHGADLTRISDCGLAGTIEFVRGSRPMFAVVEATRGRRVSLVHSTELQEGDVQLGKRYVAGQVADICGPAVLIPRIGLPKFPKIALLHEPMMAALSDCVFALKCDSEAMAIDLQIRIGSGWDGFRNMYSGTGAPYLTVKHLVLWLLEQGYNVISGKNARTQLRHEVEAAIKEFRAQHCHNRGAISSICANAVSGIDPIKSHVLQ